MSEPERLFTRYPENPILDASAWPYKANSVFNAGAVVVNDETLLLVRVEDCRGISHLTAARSRDGIGTWQIDPRPTLMPDPDRYPEEIWGVEDPRIIWLKENEEWAVTYVAYSRGGPLVSLACTKDFQNFRRMGSVMPPEDKDAALFPRRFGGRWAMIHRPTTVFFGGRVHMWVSFSPDLRHWGDHQILIESREGGWWDANKIGLNPPPLETPEGWLILYHGVRQTAAGCIYRLGLALLDLEDPRRVLRRSDAWVFGPEERYEWTGDVSGVVFPCGWLLDSSTDQVRLYYGAADTCICLATANLRDLLDYLLRSPEPRRHPKY